MGDAAEYYTNNYLPDEENEINYLTNVINMKLKLNERIVIHIFGGETISGKLIAIGINSPGDIVLTIDEEEQSKERKKG